MSSTAEGWQRVGPWRSGRAYSASLRGCNGIEEGGQAPFGNGATYENGCQGGSCSVASGPCESQWTISQPPMRAQWHRMKWDTGRAISPGGLARPRRTSRPWLPGADRCSPVRSGETLPGASASRRSSSAWPEPPPCAPHCDHASAPHDGRAAEIAAPP